ncbi:MAG: hypothetical protein ABIN67_15705 [Ferruginibacter sp.]
MRDFKSSLLLMVSILLLIALGLLATACYHFFYKATFYKPVVELTNKDRIIITTGTRDSVQQVYIAAINHLDKKLDSLWNNTDSLSSTLDNKLTEFYTLRQEISLLLKDEMPNASLALARRKVRELQERIAALQLMNGDVANENDRLTAILNRAKHKDTLGQKEQIFNVKKKTGYTKKTPPVNFTISELHISAFRLNNDKEQETFNAQETNKLICSFTVGNNNLGIKDAEVMLVIMQPDGKLLYVSNTESGYFQTTEGRRMYTLKTRFDYAKGDQKKLAFAINAGSYQQGNYIIRLYQNGILLAKKFKALL